MAENMIKTSVHFSIEFNLYLHCLGFVTIDPSEFSLSSLPLHISLSSIVTRYNQSVTGCGSQQKHVVVTQRKLMQTAWSSYSNWIWLRWEKFTWNCVWCSTKTTFNVYVSRRSHVQFEDEDAFLSSNNYSVFVENHNLWRFDCTQWLYPLAGVPG